MSHALYPIPEQPTDADGRPRTAAVSVVTARRVDPNSPSSPAPVRRPPGSATDRRRAFDEAKALYEAGVSIARDNPLSAVAHFLQAAHMFEEVHGQDKNRDKSLWQAGVCYGRVGYNLRLRRDWDGAREAFRDALELFTAIRDVEKEATTLYQLSLVSSDVLSASELLKKAALIYSDLDDEVREAMCLAELGNLFGKREKDLASSLFHWRQALLLYLKIGDKEKEARALYSIGEILVRSDRQAAHDHFLQAKAVFQHLGGKSAKWFGNCSYQLGKLCVAEKAFPAAVEHFEEACTVFRNIELETDEAWALYRLALVMLKVDSRDLAIDYLTEARRLFAEVGNERQAEGSCLLRLGEIFKHTNPDMAKTLLEEVGSPSQILRSTINEGRY
ncbi:hypothetical protein JCM11491_007116 [Sporobolomyces phaffii]